jgi:hypothetical protein
MFNEGEPDAVQFPEFGNVHTHVTGVETYFDLPIVLIGLLFSILAVRQRRGLAQVLLLIGFLVHAARQSVFYFEIPATYALMEILRWIGTVGWIALAAGTGALAIGNRAMSISTSAQLNDQEAK